jgi:hypothetical protein
MAVQFAVARSSDKWGTITVYNAFVIVKGIYSRGSTMPDTMPKRDTASLLVRPPAINLCGIRIVLMELIAVIISRVNVTGAAMPIMPEIREMRETDDGLLLKPLVL